MLKINWKKDSGDGEYTYDTYLWLNGKPTKHLVSPASGLYFGYINDKEFGVFDTLKEAKATILEKLGLN